MSRLHLPDQKQALQFLNSDEGFWLAVTLSLLAHFLVFWLIQIDHNEDLPAGQSHAPSIEVSLTTASTSSAAKRSEAEPIEIPHHEPFAPVTQPPTVEQPAQIPWQRPVIPKPTQPKPKPVPKPVVQKPKPIPKEKPKPIEPENQPEVEQAPAETVEEPQPEKPTEVAPPPPPVAEQPPTKAAPPEGKPQAQTEPIPEPAPQVEKPVEQPKPASAKPAPTVTDEAVPEFKDDYAGFNKTYTAKSDNTNASSQNAGVETGSILNINPRIIYPLEAMKRRMTGKVVVLIHVSIDGHTESVDLLQSSGYEELDNEVLGAVQHWKFKPPRKGNTSVGGTLRYGVVFGADEEITDSFENHWREIKLYPD